MSNRFTRGGQAVAVLALPLALLQPALSAGPVPFDWTGFYVGGHVGYGRGHATASFPDAGAQVYPDQLGSLFAGVQMGYNYVTPSRLLLGVEGSVSFPNYLGVDDRISHGLSPLGRVSQHLDYAATLRGRVGYAADRWLIYATGGFALAQSRFLQFSPADELIGKVLRMRPGWSLGVGVETPIARQWTARLQYLHTSYAGADITFPNGSRYGSSLSLDTVTVGLNRHFDFRPAAKNDKTDESLPWEVHGQTTYIHQGYPAFRAPYSGTNSFPPSPQARETWTVSAFLTARLWDGGELYYNPELLQGFGLSSTVGAAGFPNGEAQKSDFAYPHYNTSRLFLRQTFGLGGEQETVESDYGQMSGKRDVNRVTVQAGKFAVHDVFDQNSYSSDPRQHFMNWSLWAAGAYDYPADRVGLTYGATAELNRKNWAVRGGYFLMPRESNSNNFDSNPLRAGIVAEFEQRYTLWSQPGKLRVGTFANRSNSGSYRETLDNPALMLDIAQTRRTRVKYGFYANVEQAISDDLGVFSRVSWNDGQNEIMAFTDIDASVAAGAVLKGAKWSRPNDRIGIAGAINGLSTAHRDFIAAGGLGVLIGDGRLNYSPEKVFEVFYAYNLMTKVDLTLDYQLLVNPAHNADRGPVSIFAGRLHAEF